MFVLTLLRFGMLLVLVTFGAPRTTGRHSARRRASDGFDLVQADGTQIEAALVRHEGVVYLTIDGETAAIAGLVPAEARALGRALLREASLAA
jgi:hypothetical protein